MDARRGQLYNAVFAFNGVMLTRITPDRAIAASELESELQAFDAPVVRRLESDAWGVILAAEHAADAEPTPVYLRPSQAERELLEKRHD
jgi:tRNA A37 threonylcarbamoyladenosine modification protein TsaB